MKRTFLAAAVASLPIAAGAATQFPATQFPSATLPAHLRVARGQSIQQAIQLARLHARIDALRAAQGTPVLGAPAHGASDTKNIQPSITGGTVLSTTLTVGQATSIPEAQVSYKTGPSGLAGLTLVFTSPDGIESLSLSYSPQGLATHATVTFEQPGNVPYYSQPGQWPMVAAYIGDYAGNFVSYTQDQLAALFPAPYINVVNNGPVDIAPPTVTAGQILTPTVSLSSPVPVFEASLTGSDDVSGIYQPFVAVVPPGGSFGQVDVAPMPFPLPSGTGTAYSTLFAGQPTGTWTISFYALCDVAGNCFSDTSPADVQTLFGTTTFQVTN
jgi:hypothetical protein